MSSEDDTLTEENFMLTTFGIDAVRNGRNPPATFEATARMAPHGITVAAIIPLYNGSPFIREALESVLAQTEPADEIIVVDDGSTDDGAGAAIVTEMAKDHPIWLLTKKNGGQGSARNTGIAACRSSHIALLDQDDIWYEDHLAILKRPFRKSSRHENLGLVYGNMDRIDKLGRMVRHNFLDEVASSHPKTSLFQCLNKDMFILPGASLFTKAAWEEVGGFDERLVGYEDDDLFIRMFSAGIDSVFLNEAVFKWRIYSESTSYSPRMAKSRMIYFRKLLEQYPDNLRQNWSRDAIGPRFFDVVCAEFVEGVRLRDRSSVERAWSDIKEVLPIMSRRIRRRMTLVAPLIGLLRRGPFSDVAGYLLLRAIRSKPLKPNRRRDHAGLWHERISTY